MTQAGDIVLKAGNDIHVHNVQVKSSGGSVFTAKFSASAGHSFFASGDINVHAIAHGSSQERAVASANILARNDVHLHNILVSASAVQNSVLQDQNAAAVANLQIDASHGNIFANGNIVVQAFGLDHGSSALNARARGNALANLHASEDIDIAGCVEVSATAIEDNVDGNNARSLASLFIIASHSHVSVSGDIDVTAIARDAGATAHANAQASIVANIDVTINGNITLDASASGINRAASQAHGIASLLIHANRGNITVNHDIDIDVSGADFGTNQGSASAIANARANIFANNGNIDLAGNVELTAHAVQSGDHDSNSSASARANLLIDANAGHVNIGHDVIVNAFAQQFGSSRASANAKVNIFANTDVTINGNVDLTASADNLGSAVEGANARANLRIFAATGDVMVNHDIDVEAFAHSHGTGAVEANALANIRADSNVVVNGNIEVVGSATNPGDSASNATGLATLRLNAVNGGLTINHDVTVRASASGGGSSSVAFASAVAKLVANTDVNVGGDVEVAANALLLNSHGDGANANASLLIYALTGHASVGGNIDVRAIARSSGTDSVLASAQANVRAHNDININGDVDVTANALHSGLVSSSAIANANLELRSLNGHVDINHGIMVEAVANELGSTGAVANAQVNIRANTSIDIAGVALVEAIASLLGTGSSGALALANLQLNAHNAVIVGGLNVQAHAISEGTGSANATARANVLGSNVTIGNAIVKAVASANGVAVSNATLLVTDGSFIHMTGSVNVEADLVGSGFSPIGADALASFDGNTIQFDGPVRVVSKTTGSHAGTGSVFANTLLNVHATHKVTFGNSIDVEALVNGSDAHTINAHPVVQITASSLEVDNNLKVLANANGASANSVIAAPVLNLTNVPQVVTNGIELDAFAHGHGVKLVEANAKLVDSSHTNFNDLGLTKVFAKASGSSDGLIQADATLQVNVPNNASFGGGIDVVASAIGLATSSHHGAASIVANAIANIQANNHLTFGNDVTVTALASGNTATKVTAQALGLLRGINGVNLTTGNIDVWATANAGNRVSFGTGAAVASLDIFAENGGVHLGGDVDVTANVSYQPNSSATFDGVIAGNAFALANASVIANNGDVTVDGNIDVNAMLLDKAAYFGSFFSVTGFGQPGDMFLPQTAAALLDIHAKNGDVTLHGVTVTANDQINGSQHNLALTDSNIFAGAIALASIGANSGNVDMGALDVEAVMNAPSANGLGFKFGVVGALAAVNVHAGSNISAGSVTVEALANVGGIQTFSVCGPLGIGDAVAIANFSAGSSVNIDGNVTVEASYNGIFAQHGIVIAALNVNAIADPPRSTAT